MTTSNQVLPAETHSSFSCSFSTISNSNSTTPGIDMIEQNDQPVANLTAPEPELDVDETTTENETVANVVSTRSPLGLLDLPPELRVMIFRHLLVEPQGINVRRHPSQAVSSARSSLAIFRTNGLIHDEAFEVFYGENRFMNFLGSMILLLDPFYARFPFSQIAATNQKIHVDVFLGSSRFREFAIQVSLKLMPDLGNPSILRGTLVVDFSNHCPAVTAALPSHRAF